MYTRALQTPFADPLGGPARNLNINEIVCIKTWVILLMLQFRRFINVAQVLGARNRWICGSDFVENSPQTTVLETTTQERQPGNDRGRRIRHLPGRR